MPGGGFTGNTSVDWFVTTGDSRTGGTRIRSIGNYGIDHRGIENTNGGGYRFVIAIRHPTDDDERENFLKQLAAAAADKKSRRTILNIPIEDVESKLQATQEPQDCPVPDHRGLAAAQRVETAGTQRAETESGQTIQVTAD